MGQLSNPVSSSSTPGQSGFSITIRNARDLAQGDTPATDRELEAWFELKGQLSNPTSSLNKSLDLILGQLQALGYQPSHELPSPRPTRKRRVVRRLTRSEVDQLVALYLAGNSAPALAKQFGIHTTTAFQHLERRGVPRRVNTRKLNDEQAAEIRNLHKIGLTYVELGRRYGVHPRTVRREIDRLGD